MGAQCVAESEYVQCIYSHMVFLGVSRKSFLVKAQLELVRAVLSSLSQVWQRLGNPQKVAVFCDLQQNQFSIN